MRLSELQNKDIVNITDGKKIGKIIDVKIEAENGKIITMIVEEDKSMKNFLISRNELEVYWNQIEKIGEDVILVKFN